MTVSAAEVAFVSYIYLEGTYIFCLKRVLPAFF